MAEFIASRWALKLKIFICAKFYSSKYSNLPRNCTNIPIKTNFYLQDKSYVLLDLVSKMYTFGCYMSTRPWSYEKKNYKSFIPCTTVWLSEVRYQNDQNYQFFFLHRKICKQKN